MAEIGAVLGHCGSARFPLPSKYVTSLVGDVPDPMLLASRACSTKLKVSLATTSPKLVGKGGYQTQTLCKCVLMPVSGALYRSGC